MSDIVLELKHVTRIFGSGDTEVRALDDVSLPAYKAAGS